LVEVFEEGVEVNTLFPTSSMKATDLKELNKGNISIKQKRDLLIVKSSFLRFTLIRNLIFLFLLNFMLFFPTGNPYLFISTILIVFFTYLLWEDLKSINSLEINTQAHIIRIRHSNYIRYLILHKWDGYKKLYHFNEIKSFTIKEKWGYKAHETRYYLILNLREGHSFILLDVPHEPHANSISSFLNELLRK
jgi:hypothetical protein